MARLSIALLFGSLCVLVLATVPAMGQGGEPERKEPSDAGIVAAARTILDGYHGDAGGGGKRKLRLICWRPNDREYPGDNVDRMTRIMEHIRDFFAGEMDRHGFGGRTIQLDYGDDGRLRVHHAVGSAPFADYRKPEGDRVRQDCWPVLEEAGLDPDRETVVIFTNLSDWDPGRNTFVHKSPYYARGNHRAGIAWQLMSPELDTRNLPLKEPMIQDGEYGRISLGKHNSIFIGGIAHELGHGLGLPHCRGHDDEVASRGTALMGSGNRTYADETRGEGKGTFLSLASALRLASHPQFSGSTKGMNQPAQAAFSGMRVEDRGRDFRLSGKVTSPIPVYAIVAYLDPEGRGDYDSRTICTVPDGSGAFTLACDQLVPGRKAAIRVFALLANGATSRWQSSYEVAKDGSMDVSLLVVSTELADFVAALGSNEVDRARALADALPEGGRSRGIAETILAARDPERAFIDLAEGDPADDNVPLSRIRPEEAEVGWGRPAYDFLPRPETLLVSGGRLFTTGIYAHAPARHLYTLPKGHDWKTLSGHCGLPDQRGGSVAFRVLVDGNQAFATGKVEPGRARPFEIDVRDAERLELLVDDAGDGKAVDWGFWFDPVLSR